MSNQNAEAARLRKKSFAVKDLGILIVLIFLILVLSIISPAFANVGNFINIFKQAAINGILATGMMCVILTGGFDMSVGSTVGLTGVVAALLAQGQYPIIVPILLSMFIGLLVGITNGICISYLAIPAFVVTLGTQSLVRGLAYLVSGGEPVFGVSQGFENIAGGKLFGQIPLLVVYYILIALFFGFILTKTVFGRRIYAVGGNAISAEVSGINVKFMKMLVYSICGMLAGVAGFLLTSRTVSGSPVAGEGYELDAISAVVIGGISMDGGVGNWYGTIIGAILLAVISNGLDILRVSSYYQYIIKGIIIIVAVFLDIRSRARDN